MAPEIGHLLRNSQSHQAHGQMLFAHEHNLIEATVPAKVPGQIQRLACPGVVQREIPSPARQKKRGGGLQARQNLQTEITQIAQDQIARLDQGEDVRRGSLVVAGEARKGQLQDGALQQIGDTLNFQGGFGFVPPIVPGKDGSQVVRQRLGGAVMEQNPFEGSEPAAGSQREQKGSKQSHGQLPW